MNIKKNISIHWLIFVSTAISILLCYLVKVVAHSAPLFYSTSSGKERQAASCASLVRAPACRKQERKGNNAIGAKQINISRQATQTAEQTRIHLKTNERKTDFILYMLFICMHAHRRYRLIHNYIYGYECTQDTSGRHVHDDDNPLRS